MTRRPDFTKKVKGQAWARAGGPSDPRCECGCGQRISPSDPAEYHHIEEAESGDRDDPVRWAYLKSLENCQCVRASCHKRLTRTVTIPKVKKSRRQREGQANIRKPKRKIPYRLADGTAMWNGKESKRSPGNE